MITRSLMLAVLAALASGAAFAATADYKFEAQARAEGTATRLLVKLRHLPTGSYVTNASVWHVDRHQSFKGPTAFAETRRRLQPDGAGGYTLLLPLHSHPAAQRLVAALPGAAGLVDETVAVAVKN